MIKTSILYKKLYFLTFLLWEEGVCFEKAGQR